MKLENFEKVLFAMVYAFALVVIVLDMMVWRPY